MAVDTRANPTLGAYRDAAWRVLFFFLFFFVVSVRFRVLLAWHRVLDRVPSASCNSVFEARFGERSSGRRSVGLRATRRRTERWRKGRERQGWKASRRRSRTSGDLSTALGTRHLH